MNPKQLACVILMMVIGLVTYFGQIAHQKVALMKKSAARAEQDASMAESNRQTSEILAARAKAETEESRRFLSAWLPHVDRAQTEQEVESAIELSLRESGITLVRTRKSEVKSSRISKIIPKSVLTTLEVEDEYQKVMNWMGQLERRLPISRVKAWQVTGGGGPQLVRMDISLETPLIDLDQAAQGGKKKS